MLKIGISVPFTDMPKLLTPRGPGRPTQDKIDILRTRTWINALKHRTGLNNGHALLAHFEPELIDEDGIVRNKKWVHYDKGRRVPQSFKGEPSAVEIAEITCPGTSEYFNSAIWQVLKKVPLNPWDIDRRLATLGASVAEIIQPRPHRASSSAWDFNELGQSEFDELAKLGTFDALEAVVLITSKAEAISAAELRNLSQKAYFAMAPAIAKLPEFDGIVNDVFMAIDTCQKHWVYVSGHSRMEVVIFVQGYLESLQSNAPDSLS